MSYQEDFDIAQRYDLLCRASQSHVEQDGQRLQLAADLDVLDKIINHDLPELARSGSPDHFADILKSLNLELEHFREFCEFPDLAQKVVVGVGGAFSAGKSSLINTLLGKKRLVVEIDPTTSLPTYLLHGEQEQITALNLFRRRVILSQDEFASLTHEEKIKYGSQIAGLLRSAFISDPDFTWKNIALLDTPGYSKPDSEQWSERTDESVARSQLNLSNFIIWVVSATQGTISEDDLKFLATLNADIPKLIVVSRADAKTPEDIAKIVALVKQMTAERCINVLDVIPMSARKKNDYPVQPIVDFLGNWDNENKKLNFVYNFRKLFTEYSRYMHDKQKQAEIKLDQINQMIFLSDNEKILENAYKLQGIEQDSISNWQNSVEDYDYLQTKFFDLIQNISEKLSSHTEQFIDLHAVLSNTNCSTEMLLKYAKVTDDDLLQIIYRHPNCPISLLEDLIDKPIGNLSFEMIEMLLEHQNIRKNNQRIYEHLDMVDVNLLPRKLRLEIASSPFLSKKTQLCLIQKPFILLKRVLAKNPAISVDIQSRLAQDDDYAVRGYLAANPKISKSKQLKLSQDEEYRIYLAENSNLCEEVQIILSEDESHSEKSIKRALALNDNISKFVQSKISKDKSFSFLIDEYREKYDIGFLDGLEKDNIFENIQLIFAEQGDSFIKKCLVKNPNLSENAQLRLAQDVNIEIKRELSKNKNIINSVYLKLMSDISVKNYMLACNQKDLDMELFLLLTKEDDIFVITALAENKNINKNMQLKLIQYGNHYVNYYLAKNLNVNKDVQLILSESESEDVVCSLAKNININENVQLILLQNKNNNVRFYLAENLNISKDVQLALAQDQNKSVRCSLAKNKNIYEDVQLMLVDDKEYMVRESLAGNLNISEMSQLKLLEDCNFKVRSSLAYNGKISEILQLKLAKDQSDDVRVSLAANRSIYETIQLILIQDQSQEVRESLAGNPHTTEKVLVQLFKNYEFDIYAKVERSEMESLWSLCRAISYAEHNKFFSIKQIATEYSRFSGTINFRFDKLINKEISYELQLELLKFSNNDEGDMIEARKTLAQCPNIHEDIQLRLATDENESIKYTLFQNPNLSVKVEQLLS